ncbi:MAG: RecB-family nuclease, partial [Ignisphaera sp.]
MSIVSAFIVVKPVGIAAQTGLPEVFKLAYKLDRRFLVFPRLQDLKEMIKIDEALFIVHNVDDAPDICEIDFRDRENIGVVVQAGETPF